MTRLTLLLTVIVSVLSAVGRAPRDVPNVHLQQATAWVSDPDNIIDPDTRRRADAMLDSLNSATTVEVAIAVVDNLDGIDIDTYATDLFTLWGIGKKDTNNGLLIVISRDDRKAALRTGYGMEGVINDARAGRIIRHVIAPNMRNDNAGAAIIGAIDAVSLYIKDPEAADYLYSNMPGNDEEDNFFAGYLVISICITLALVVWLIVTYLSTSRHPDQERYTRLEQLKLPILTSLPLTLGMSAIAWLPLWALMRHTRLHRHDCPNCGTRMSRVDEIKDNDYLTPSQDIEEQLNSVDYDVWLCPMCNETDIIPYINRRSRYTMCPHCGTRARSLQADRILRQPTTSYEGQGIRIYHCYNCNKTETEQYTIAKVAQTPIIIGGGGRFGGGGGFSGGSFGGGMTGGGGASGGW